MVHFNWTYVSTVASQGEYGESGIEAFKKEAEKKGVCFAVNRKIKQDASPDDFDLILQVRLQSKSVLAIVSPSTDSSPFCS